MTARVFDALIAVSNNTRRDTERIIPAARGKVFAIPLASRFQPPDTPLPRPPEAETPFLLLVANVTANKNPSIVIAALATLVAAGRTMRLVHVGNDEFGYLAAAASANGVDAHVVQLGKVSDARLASLYAHAAATVVVSLYEGFGLPVLEAQTFGSPLVCANRASLPEVAGKGAIMVDPTDSAAIADAVARIVDDPGFAAVLRERGIANAASFSWDRTAAETLALFQRIVAEQSI